jgi:hypothetical protein
VIPSYNTIVLEPFRLDIDGAIHCGMDDRQNSFDIIRHLAVPKSDDLVTLVFQPLCPYRIPTRMPLFAVLRSVNLDHKFGRHAGKVGDIGTNRYLSPEMAADYRVSLQVLPELPLGESRGRPQASRGASAKSVDGHVSRSPHPARVRLRSSERPSPSRGG